MKKEYTIQDFPHKRERENIIVVVRRHWWVLVKYFGTMIVQLAIGVLVVVLLLLAGVDFLNEGLPQLLLVLGGSLYLLFVWVFFLHHWVDYFLDVWIVTDERILNIVQNGLFSRTVSEVSIVNIQDVTAITHGKMQTLLDFGDVSIQTAAEEGRFLFDNVANPEGIASRITEVHETAVYKKEKGEHPAEYNVHAPRSKKSRSVNRKKATPGKTIREQLSDHDDEIDFRDELMDDK